MLKIKMPRIVSGPPKMRFIERDWVLSSRLVRWYSLLLVHPILDLNAM